MNARGTSRAIRTRRQADPCSTARRPCATRGPSRKSRPDAVPQGLPSAQGGRIDGQNGLLPDHEIARLCRGERPLIAPFVPYQQGKPSYGLGSYGYDLRLGKGFLVAVSGKGATMDPRDPSPGRFHRLEAEPSFDLAPGAHVLAESQERLALPDDLCGLVYGKSTYARCGLIVNATPLEPGWHGVLTLSLKNVGSLPVRLHVGFGIAQVLFWRSERPARAYGEKEAGGAYQGQRGATPAV
ncbi:MAG: dCTP deaminase [Candidatus Bipolaricaulota bacterium]